MQWLAGRAALQAAWRGAGGGSTGALHAALALAPMQQHLAPAAAAGCSAAYASSSSSITTTSGAAAAPGAASTSPHSGPHAPAPMQHTSAPPSQSSPTTPPPQHHQPPTATIQQPQPPAGFSTADLITDSSANVPLKSAEFASSFDDKFGVQRNWFTALYKQLNYIAKTGTVKELAGRQKEVFQQVERVFEGLYDKHIKGRGYDETAHRSMLMCCLSVATYRVLSDEIPDTKLVREIIRTNLGAMMVNLLRPLHRFKLWVLRHILREDMYRNAVGLLPVLAQDMGSLCDSSVEGGEGETALQVSRCKYHEVLTQEETPFLLSEFCCHHSLLWMHEYRKHGVVVSLDSCMAWDDKCCKLRIGRVGHQAAAAAPAKAGEGGSVQAPQ